MDGLVAFYMHDLSGGGVERMRLALMAELRARGLEICLIVGRRAGALVGLVPDDLEVIPLDRQGMVGSVLPLARVLRSLRPAILVASLDHNNVTAILAAAVARVGTRVIVCQHNALSAELAAGWRYRAIPLLYWLLQRGAHGMVAVSRGVADDLAATARIARSRITTIYNPVVGADFVDQARGGLPHPWLESKGLPVCIFAGRLTEQKDPSLAIRAVARLGGRDPVRLILLGEGPLLGKLQRLVIELGVEDRVAFAGFQANPLPWIARAGCLILTSRHEGLGNVLIEAMALGTPVVATDCPFGPSEILLGGALGALVPVGDSGALANAIGWTLRQAPDRAALRARAAVFSAAACADAHLALFARVQARRPFGLALSTLSAASVAERVMQKPPARGPNLVVTPNIDHVRLLRRREFAEACRSAAILCADGLPVAAYARWRGVPLAGRVTGCEIFRILAEHRAIGGKSVCLVVESAATARAAQAWAARAELANLRVLTAPRGLADDALAAAALAHAISGAAPDIVVMTLGAPVSEIFIHRHRDGLPACWALCLGQAVRVYLGLAERAPKGWQQAGLEWLWRLRREPRRLAGRYLRALAWFPFAVLVDIARGSDQPSA